jgi:hypothetical protein
MSGQEYAAGVAGCNWSALSETMFDVDQDVSEQWDA